MNKTPEHKAVELLVRLHFGRHRKKQPKNPVAQHDHELTRGWGWEENVLGIGVGEKHVEGKRQQAQRCLTIFTRRKMANRHLSDRERIPSSLMLESVGESVVTDLVVLPARPHAQAAPDAIFRPVQPGTGIGNGSVGTLGLLVRQGNAPQVLALSCSHVLARSGKASPGSFIEQSPVATGDDLTVGTLTNDFTKLNTNGTFSEDVALAALTTQVQANMVDTGVIVNSFSEATQLPVGMLVTRDGVGSGNPQDGEILFHQVAFDSLDMPFVGPVSFTGLVAYSAQNAEGDSGAVILLKNTAEVVGLHIGAIDSQISLFQPIGPIMTNHNLTLFTG